MKKLSGIYAYLGGNTPKSSLASLIMQEAGRTQQAPVINASTPVFDPNFIYRQQVLNQNDLWNALKLKLSVADLLNRYNYFLQNLVYKNAALQSNEDYKNQYLQQQKELAEKGLTQDEKEWQEKLKIEREKLNLLKQQADAKANNIKYDTLTNKYVANPNAIPDPILENKAIAWDIQGITAKAGIPQIGKDIADVLNSDDLVNLYNTDDIDDFAKNIDLPMPNSLLGLKTLLDNFYKQKDYVKNTYLVNKLVPKGEDLEALYKYAKMIKTVDDLLEKVSKNKEAAKIIDTLVGNLMASGKTPEEAFMTALNPRVLREAMTKTSPDLSGWYGQAIKENPITKKIKQGAVNITNSLINFFKERFGNGG